MTESKIAFCFYRAMYFSAKRGLAIACRPSVCPSVSPVCNVGGSGSHRLEILEAFGLCSPKAIHLFPVEHGEILGKLEVGLGKVVCWSTKSGNISETRKDRRKITMEGLYKLPTLFRTEPSRPLRPALPLPKKSNL